MHSIHCIVRSLLGAARMMRMPVMVPVTVPKTKMRIFLISCLCLFFHSRHVTFRLFSPPNVQCNHQSTRGWPRGGPRKWHSRPYREYRQVQKDDWQGGLLTTAAPATTTSAGPSPVWARASSPTSISQQRLLFQPYNQDGDPTRRHGNGSVDGRISG